MQDVIGSVEDQVRARGVAEAVQALVHGQVSVSLVVGMVRIRAIRQQGVPGAGICCLGSLGSLTVSDQLLLVVADAVVPLLVDSNRNLVRHCGRNSCCRHATRLGGRPSLRLVIQVILITASKSLIIA